MKIVKDILAMEQQIAHQKASMEQVYTERETNHRTVLKEQLYRQFRVVDDNFHFKDQPGAVAFKDKGERIISASNDDRVTQAMATMAEAKGWKTIKVSGHPDFQRKIWMEANLRGIEVQGYKPTQQERQQLDDMRDRRMQNAVLSVSDVVDQNQKKPSLRINSKNHDIVPHRSHSRTQSTSTFIAQFPKMLLKSPRLKQRRKKFYERIQAASWIIMAPLLMVMIRRKVTTIS